MRRADGPFPAFRLWWRGASNGPRSRAIAAGTATVGVLAWIAVPSGGGVLANFAAGLPVSSTTPAGQGGGPSGPSAQLASNSSGLGTASALLSPEASATAGDNGGLGAASGDNPSAASVPGDSGSVAPDTGSSPGTPGGPTTPSQSCPVPFPTTGTPLDGITAQVSALCAQVLAPGSGPVPAGALPGGSAGATSAGGPPQVPRQWMYLDAPLAAAGGPNSAWSPGLSTEMAGKSPTVAVGLVQGAPVSPALAGAVGDLLHHGALVRLVLVPEPSAAGGPAALGSWVTQVLGALPPVPLVEIGTGAAPKASSPGAVAADTVAGLAAAHDTPSHPAAGVAWLDDGTASGDAPVWSALDSAAAWSKASFVARSLDAAGACTSPATFAATLHRYPGAAALPVVSEAVQAPAPAARLAADSSCVKASAAQGPGASVANWRLWEGPVPR
jgi:hypothetical protein